MEGYLVSKATQLCSFRCPLPQAAALWQRNIVLYVSLVDEVDRFQVTRCPFPGRFQSACKRGGYEVTATPIQFGRMCFGIFVPASTRRCRVDSSEKVQLCSGVYYRRHCTLHEAPLPPTVRERERAIHTILPGPEEIKHEYEHHQPLLVNKGKQLFLDTASSRNYRHSR